MRPIDRFAPTLLPVALAAVLALLPACSSEEDDRWTRPTVPTTADALAGYWQAQSGAATALGEADDHWEAFAALAADPDTDPQAVASAAAAYRTACDAAADRLAAWRDLEQYVVPGGKAQFTEVARATALAVLGRAGEAAATGGEALVVCWQTLGGLASLRVALADPEGTIPVNGTLADWLVARLQARDTLVTVAILADQDHGGRLPLAQLAGDTPAARAAAYADLDDDDPVKRACRASVPAWNEGERVASLALFERAGRGSLRLFGSVGAGGASLAELPAHLTGAGEAAPPLHAVTLDLRGADGSAPLTTTATVLVHRRGQQTAMPRLAMLAGVTAQSMLELPAGSYDLLVLADGWARAIAVDVATSNNLTVSLSLNHLEQSPLVLEGITVAPMGGAGMTVEASATAVSSRGDPLNFAWSVGGGPVREANASGALYTFVPEQAGQYMLRVTVSDGRGQARTDSTGITVVPFAVRVIRTVFMSEQIPDTRLNPGEVDTLQLWVANRGSEGVVGEARFVGVGGVMSGATPEQWTLAAGAQTRWKVPVMIPADWDEPEARFDFSFTVDGVTLVQELTYRVDFYARIDFIRSPVTSRILNVSGWVANPQLATAELVIDRDLRQVYNLPLQNGRFEQVIILPGSAQSRRVRLDVTARAGSREARARAGFAAVVPRADFRATLFWNTNGTDVDLWVTDPAGERCYFANRQTASGLELDVDDVNGYGPENITGLRELPAGDYLVQIHYWSDHGTGLASDCTVMLTLFEATPSEQVEVFQQTLTNNQVWTVATVTWDGAKVTRVRVTPAGAVHEAPVGLPAK